MDADGSTEGLDERVAREIARSRLFGSEPKGVHLGRYLIIERLGSGALGVVYLARDPELDRRVALKVVRPRVRDVKREDEAQLRLVQEARLAAKLSHPNVVQVYDVGVSGADVFFAMELVDGMSLRQWLAEAERSPTEVLDTFVQAGRGLLTAHEKNVVHRDFKPDNVLVDRMGRVRVADFGLATITIPAETEPTDGATQAEWSGARGVTATGCVVGTPAYMAPEVHRGGRGSELSDQFSYCVALFEALHGQHPFPARTYKKLRDAVLRGVISAPSRKDVPARIDAAVRKGLAVEPSDRFVSMAELLAVLEHDSSSSRARRRLFVGVVSVGCAGAGVVAWQEHATVESCEALRTAADAVWNEDTRARLESAILDVDVAYAEETWSRIQAGLDGYAATLGDMRADACLAANVRDELSASDLTVRQACLAERGRDLASLVDVFTHPDPALLHRAALAVVELPAPNRCINPVWARDSAASEDSRDAREVDASIRSARSMRLVGRYDEAREVASATRRRAIEAHLPVLAVRASYESGRAIEEMSDPSAAIETLDQAFHEASALGLDTVAVATAIRLLHVNAVELGRYEQAELWSRNAAAMLERFEVPEQRIDLLIEQGALLDEQGRSEEAIRVYEQCLELAEAVYGTDHPETTRVAGNLAGVLRTVGRADEAIELSLWALRVDQAALGEHHRWVALDHQNLGTLYHVQGDNERAEEHALLALEVLREAGNESDPAWAEGLHTLADIQGELGRPREAEKSMRRAIELQSRTRGPVHVTVGAMRTSLAKHLLRQRKFVEASEEARRGSEIIETAVGSDNPLYGHSRDIFALARALDGDLEGALAAAVEADEALEAGLPIQRLFVKHLLAELLRRQGKLEAALRYARDALPATAADAADLRVGERAPCVTAWLALHDPEFPPADKVEALRHEHCADPLSDETP